MNQAMIHGMDVQRMFEDADPMELKPFAATQGIDVPASITDGNQIATIIQEGLKEEGSVVSELAKQVKNLEKTAATRGMEHTAKNLENKKAALEKMLPAVEEDEVYGEAPPIEKGFEKEVEKEIEKEKPSPVLESKEEVTPKPIPEVTETEKVEGAKAEEAVELTPAKGKEVISDIDLNKNIDKEIDRLLYAPLTPKGKTKFNFKTKTEISDFKKGFQKGVAGKPKPELHGIAQKYQDAADHGWDEGRRFSKQKPTPPKSKGKGKLPEKVVPVANEISTTSGKKSLTSVETVAKQVETAIQEMRSKALAASSYKTPIEYGEMDVPKRSRLTVSINLLIVS